MPIKREQTNVQQTANVEHALLKVRSESGQTIAAHAEIIATKGAAMLGKMGRDIGPLFRVILNQQITDGINTYLFLTLREGWNGPFVTYRCALKGAYETLAAEKKALVPRYYIHESANIKTWFKITSIERMTREEMNRIFVLSSGREIMSVINTSGTFFRVGIRR
jgi:hypothetical protein